MSSISSEYSEKEELMNALSHGIGLLMSIAGLILLINKGMYQSNVEYTVSLIVFGVSLIMVYGTSTAYHWVKNPKLKQMCKVFDHVAIYFLIAGTYTPFTLITLGDTWGWWMFGIIWTLALIGTIFKLFFTGRFNLVSTLLYVAMGWLALIVTRPLIQSLDWDGFLLLAAGGAVYTLGTLFYLAERLPYNHAVWHIFVIGGSVLHFLSIFLYVKPPIGV
ncbi:PAQR family membrane homeostasis protein TrhA [Pseudobacteriovorax antillogorgiicola]|uniref:Hemolysin III n=1 Tax=Pseudobacteriovorax antillogorgiicola TaxID=1513793 RepID=A0A1Y6CC22_9BACT|nr:hemolysin III family protein [Pseudobacteriovorax antillogorgiicola]TCS48347.1 hemolysin III [Pseudobacteriovorax antillogorgiicola]SMF56314.1 hemolysin III [Pseudobacteriovorax antillogorgiicola]